MSRVWSREVFDERSDAVARIHEISKHLDADFKIHERTVRVENEPIKVYVLVVKTRR